MTLAAAGLSAALAGSPDQVDAQATGFAMQLSDGTEVVMNTETIPVQVQGDILDRLQGCIGGGESSRDQCIVKAAVDIARERLDAVIVETRTSLAPLGDEIGIAPDEFIREPLYCDYAPTDGSLEACQDDTEIVTLAGLDVQIAETRARRIEVETRVAGKEETLATTEAERDASAAVLAALQRVAAGNRTN